MWSSLRGRLGSFSVAALIVLTGLASEARAVILYSSATRNTTAPSESDGLDAWNLEATWGSFLATPIDATHFIAAQHVWLASSTITFQGVTYQVDASSRKTDPGSDLVIYSLASGSFSTWATLYCTSNDGTVLGKTISIIGRGTQRGSAVTVSGATKGWMWGSSDGVQSWGKNVVNGLTSYGSTSNALLYFNFDGNGIANEGALSSGDSSGGVFVYSDGVWKLAGINYAVDSPWSYTGSSSDSGFYADIYDARGLYYKNSSGSWTLASGSIADPGASYASCISSRLQWIESVILQGDANLDTAVDFTDLSTLLAHYNQTGTWAKGDFNSDGYVDFTDLTTLLANYNRSQAPVAAAQAAAVPEPSAIALVIGWLGIAACWLARRRRR